MKFYTIPDENFEVLEQNGHFHVVDDSFAWMNMYPNGGITINGDGGMPVDDNPSMISNLPLLFASGYPTSLDLITMVSQHFS